MNELPLVAPAFVALAHRIVWCTVATGGEVLTWQAGE